MRDIQSLILISGFASLQQVVKDHLGSWPAATCKQRFNNLKQALAISCHTLIIHGKKDKIVFPYHAHQLYLVASKLSKGHLTSIHMPSHMSHVEFDY
jgi:dipeptidyl aminopeptidase/acylaminoacyl peptidase